MKRIKSNTTPTDGQITCNNNRKVSTNVHDIEKSIKNIKGNETI